MTRGYRVSDVALPAVSRGPVPMPDLRRSLCE